MLVKGLLANFEILLANRHLLANRLANKFATNVGTVCDVISDVTGTLCDVIHDVTRTIKDQPPAYPLAGHS